MHPAFSVIFLTTLIGIGQGLFLALYTGQVYSLAKLLPAQDSQNFYALGSFVALVFLAGGFARFVFSSWSSRACLAFDNPVADFLVITRSDCSAGFYGTGIFICHYPFFRVDATVIYRIRHPAS